MKIGIIGKGFVGSAVKFGFSPNTGVDYEVFVYDKDPSKTINTLDETINSSDFIFISVPTPSKKSGDIDLKILDACLSEISETISNERSKEAIFLIRSTIVPGSSSYFQKKYTNLRIVFNPEFLTERSANYDFISQSRYILGGSKADTAKVADLYKTRFGRSISIIETTFETAELIKYMSNTFLATKVSFLNEMKILSDNVGANWEDAIEGFARDGRIGHSHMNVPGPDGKLGFGGSCFPKDIQAIINFAKQNNINLNVLSGAWKTNLEVRPERDWEKLLNRAISEE